MFHFYFDYSTLLGENILTSIIVLSQFFLLIYIPYIVVLIVVTSIGSMNASKNAFQIFLCLIVAPVGLLTTILPFVFQPFAGVGVLILIRQLGKLIDNEIKSARLQGRTVLYGPKSEKQAKQFNRKKKEEQEIYRTYVEGSSVKVSFRIIFVMYVLCYVGSVIYILLCNYGLFTEWLSSFMLNDVGMIPIE